METPEGLHILSFLDNPNIMAYFVEEPLSFKKCKYCKLGYERHFCSLFCTLPPEVQC